MITGCNLWIKNHVGKKRIGCLKKGKLGFIFVESEKKNYFRLTETTGRPAKEIRSGHEIHIYIYKSKK